MGGGQDGFTTETVQPRDSGKRVWTLAIPSKEFQATREEWTAQHIKIFKIPEGEIPAARGPQGPRGLDQVTPQEAPESA